MENFFHQNDKGFVKTTWNIWKYWKI